MGTASLSIILPVFNEKEVIEYVLSEWKTLLEKNKIPFNFVICEDGSTDGTKELLKRLKLNYPIILNQKRKRRGYGNAVLDGIKSALSEFLLCVDSDGQCDPEDFLKFWKERMSADILIGRRRERSDPLQRKVFSNLFRIVHKTLFTTSIHDPSTPFVLFRKKVVTPYINYLTYLNEGFWWGFIAMAVKAKLSVNEIPINHRKTLCSVKTKVYTLDKIPSIAFRNLLGLFRLYFTK
ncbi:glycosyltransferase family 2 protein [Patescibacteria group bacterium]|nr:glycosyltransferase family 2 protein [Patescibacteria group bacterium]